MFIDILKYMQVNFRLNMSLVERVIITVKAVELCAMNFRTYPEQAAQNPYQL